jgi:outer membrane protein
MTMRLKHPRTPLAAVAAIVTCGFASSAWSQSLMELYNAARSYDATVLAARAQAQSAEFRAAQADGLGKPSAALGASLTTTRVDPSRSIFNPRGESGNSSSGQVAINGRYALLNRANEATIAQSRKALDDAQAQLDAVEQDLMVRVAQAYFDVLAAQDTLATTQASKKAITEQLASARRNFEVGTATITDTREAQARFDLATAQEIAAENDLRTKRIALDQLVGRTGVAPKPLAMPVVLPPVTPASAEEWVTGADALHPAIRRARAALEVAGLETEKAKAGRMPTIDAVGSVGAQRTGGELASASASNRTASIGVQFNLPLYTGGQVQNRISETLVLEERARNDLDAARRGVAQNTRQAFFGVQSLQAQAKALEAAESSSKLALEATQLGYRVGVRVNLDVLNAQTQLFQTQRELAKSRYDTLVGSLRLRQAAGRLTPGDIEAVDRLLAK